MKAKKIHPKKHISLYLLILLFILLLGVVLRFINTPDRYSLDGDGVRDAVVAYEGAKAFSFPLVGPFSSTGPYTFGPWYYISLILFSILFPTPYSPWILMGILSLFTIVIMADIGRLLYSKRFGVILATMTAIAPTQIGIATGLSNIDPIPFFAALSIWITLKLMIKEVSHYLWFLFLGIALGMGINAHYQMVGLLVLPLFPWFFIGWRKYYIPLFVFLGVFLTFIPLLIFNMQNNWHTLSGLHEMLIARERTYVPNSWGIYIFQFWTSHLKFLLNTPNFVTISLIVTFIGTFFVDITKKRSSSGLIMLVIIFLINFLWLRYYWGERHDVYLYYLSPILFIFLGYTLNSLFEITYGKILFILFALVIGGNMLLTDYTQIIEASKSESLSWKEEVHMLLQKYPDNNIILYSCNPYYEPHKRTLVYLLSFYYQPQAPTKRIAMKGYGCSYPNTKDLDFSKSKIKDKFAKVVYPPLFPEVKDENFNFIDISQATPSAIKAASWQPVSIVDIFNSTVNWWK